MQDLPRSIHRTDSLHPVLAHMLSRVLATLPRVKTLPYMQADHYSVGFETHISLMFPKYPGSLVDIDVEMRLYTDWTINTDAAPNVHIISLLPGVDG
jgi:hypothetical protein